MLYTLIIMMAMSGGAVRPGGVTVESIQGFQTEQACENAKRKLTYPRSDSYTLLSYTATCVPMSI